MKIGSTILPDPTTYDVSTEHRTKESTTVSGARRYSKLAGKRRVILIWNYLDSSYKSSIELLNAMESAQTLVLDSYSFSVIGYSDPVFRVIPGKQAYSCTWELREP